MTSTRNPLISIFNCISDNLKSLTKFIVYVSFLLTTFIYPQSWYNHVELDWHTIETDHFFVHYHDETERSAREAAVVAENIYGPITSIYNFEPNSKTHLIIKDVDDYSNGAAYYYDNKIEIWARPLEFDLRGAHRWMQDVITHEFTHIVQIQASMKYPRKVPGFYFQSLMYEDEKRDDVLYGYPNVIISYPIPGTAVPPWFAEGTAQVMYKDANFDFWDSHRDMILRDRTLNNNLLSFDAMNTFGKKGIGNESIYNQGFSFVNYLANRFGMDVLHDISKALRNRLNYSIRKAMKDATGIDGENLYNEWVKELNTKYVARTIHLNGNIQSGDVIIRGGTTNIHPVWSPDGNRFLFLSNVENDYFSQTDLFIYDFSDSTSKKIFSRVETAPCWVNDSTIIYTRKDKPNNNGSRLYDLFQFDLVEDVETKLTHDQRLISPVINRQLNMIAAITTYDGTSNILISEIDSIDFKPLTNEKNGLQMFSLDWSGETLLVDATEHHGRQVYEVLPDGRLNIKSAKGFDTRDPEKSQNLTITSNDKSGIFNLEIKGDNQSGYITNVTGGAFMPDISIDGRILYSLYKNGSYNIALLDNFDVIDSEIIGYADNYFETYPESDLINYGTQKKSKSYEDTFPNPFILPRLMMDYKTLKPGFYLFSSDILNRMLLFGGASINRLGDKDIFLIIEYGKWKPTFYTNLFWISRNTVQNTIRNEIYPTKSDLTIQFFSTDIGIRFPLLNSKFRVYYTYTKYRQVINQVINNDDGHVEFFGGIAFDYFRAHNVSLDWQLSTRKPEYAGNMLPSNGYEIDFLLSRENNKFMDGFGFNEEYSTFETFFKDHFTERLTITGKKHFTLNQEKKFVASLETQIGYLSNKHVDDFFYFFAGGLPGLKGYTFYNEDLHGPYLWVNTGTVRLPLFMEKSYSFAHMNFQNMSVGMIMQMGGGFESNLSDFLKNKEYKVSGGVEFRLSGYSFFGYPTAIAYEYHMPIADSEESKGKQYLTILFDF
jgi:hypothetical protein